MRSAMTSGSSSTRSPARTPWGSVSAPSRPGLGMQPGPGVGGLEGLQALGQQGADDAGQHVAGAGRGQLGRPLHDHPRLPRGRGDDGRRALEQHHLAGGRRRPARGGQMAHAPASATGSPSSAANSPSVRRQHQARPAPQRPGLPGEGEQPVGVEHSGHRALQHHPPHGRHRGRVAAQARARPPGRPGARRPTTASTGPASSRTSPAPISCSTASTSRLRTPSAAPAGISRRT